MNIRAVIVDDEKPARDKIRRLLADHPDVALVGEAADARSAVELIDRECPDLCFLDVQMPEGDGFEVLRGARHIPRVVFTTAYDQYAVRAFEVNSLDYILKPFDRRRFAAALDRAREAIRAEGLQARRMMEVLEEIRASLRPAGGPPREPPAPPRAAAASAPAPAAPASSGEAGTEGEAALGRIAGRRGGKIVLLDPAEVLWFEAEDTLVFGRTRQGRYLVNRTLADLEGRLHAERFFRSHRRYLINLAHVGEILPADEGNYRIVMRDESRSVVPLSRRQARRLRALIPW